jgi:topoisomerase IA-like protein
VLWKQATRTFVSLVPYLEWQSKTLDGLTTDDIKFLMKFPMKVSGTKRKVAFGPYGLYVKDGKQNIPLPKDKWNDVKEGKITAEYIDGLKKTTRVWKKK